MKIGFFMTDTPSFSTAAPSDEEDDGETEADLDSFLIKRKQPQSSRPAKQDSPDIMDVDGRSWIVPTIRRIGIGC